jgi:hypothetical protein
MTVGCNECKWDMEMCVFVLYVEEAEVANRNRQRGTNLYLNDDLRRTTLEGRENTFLSVLVPDKEQNVKPHRTGFQRCEEPSPFFVGSFFRSSSAGVCVLAGARVPPGELRLSAVLAGTMGQWAGAEAVQTPIFVRHSTAKCCLGLFVGQGFEARSRKVPGSPMAPVQYYGALQRNAGTVVPL